MQEKSYLRELSRKQGDIYDTINDIKYILKQRTLNGYYLSNFVAEKNK